MVSIDGAKKMWRPPLMAVKYKSAEGGGEAGTRSTAAFAFGGPRRRGATAGRPFARSSLSEA